MSDYRVIMKTNFGGTVYLGDVSDRNVAGTVCDLEDAGCAVYAPEGERFDFTECQAIPLAANPADPSRIPTDEKALKQSLEGPRQAMSDGVALLSRQITVGRTPLGRVSDRSVTYPLPKNVLEKVSLEEAAVNLAIFFKTTRELMSPEMLEMFQTNNRYIDVERLVAESSNKRAVKGLIGKITTQFVNWMISKNAKLKKSKLPASLGIGIPSDAPGWNYGPTDGAEGLQLLPNATLVKRTESNQISFRDAIEALDVGLFDPDSVEWAFKSAILDTLDNLGDTRKMSCCAQASSMCRLVCLADTNQRSATRVDILGRPFDDPKSKAYDEVSYNRMALGGRHTAFLANPYYFMRILIEAIKKRGLAYPGKLDAYNKACMEKEGEAQYALSPKDKKRFLKLVPPSVRLNVLSDYVWEMICPDLFKMFQGRSKFAGESLPRIQFYDYTKIPGRWPQSTRSIVEAEIGYDAGFEYELPSNYHITFSFSGTKGSLQLSTVQNWAGQNTTFAFQTTSLSAGDIDKLLRPEFAAQRTLIRSSGMTEAERLNAEKKLLKHLKSFKTRLIRALKKSKIRGLTISSSATPIKESLPSSYMGYPVINGDFSDLRFLDIYQKRDPDESAIVGLKWKVPHGARFEVEGLDKYRWKKASAKKRAEYIAEGGYPTPYAQFTPLGGTAYSGLGMGERAQEAGASFAQLRVALNIAIDVGLDEPVRVFIMPKETGADAIRDMFTDIYLGSDEPSFSFVTETGSLINEEEQSALEDAVEIMYRLVSEG